MQDAADNRETAKVKLSIPVLAVGGDSCLGGLVEQSMRVLADEVRGVVIGQCGHFVPEERPQELLEHLLPFLAEG